jgi:muramidase (phage lysozyme)
MSDGWAIWYGRELKCFSFDYARALQMARDLHGIIHAMVYEMTRDDLKSALDDTNVQAMITVIRTGEGTLGDDGFRKLFGGELFTSFAAHPHKLVNLSGYSSTAAGAGQFLSKTWDHLVEEYGFPDFSPECQLEGIVALIAGRGALDDVKTGNLQEAIRKCNKEWASLPESPYGQPVRTMAQAEKTFTDHGGTLA